MTYVFRKLTNPSLSASAVGSRTVVTSPGILRPPRRRRAAGAPSSSASGYPSPPRPGSTSSSARGSGARLAGAGLDREATDDMTYLGTKQVSQIRKINCTGRTEIPKRRGYRRSRSGRGGIYTSSASRHEGSSSNTNRRNPNGQAVANERLPFPVRRTPHALM